MTGSLGQDWAGYQPAAPPTAGLSFVFVKATEGTGFVNSKHDTQVTTARTAGMVVGHYHFARPGRLATQLSYFLAHADPKPGDLLAFDWEDPGVSDMDKDTWIRAAQAAAPAHQVLLYCNRDYWTNRDTTGFAGDGLWIADPDAARGTPRVAYPWRFHQYSSAGGYDRNYTPMSPAQLRAWAEAKETTLVATLDADDKKYIEGLFAKAPAANWNYPLASPTAAEGTDPKRPAGAFLAYGDAHYAALAQRLAAQDAAITALAAQLGQDVDTAQVVAAVQAAIADAVVHVQVDVTGTTP